MTTKIKSTFCKRKRKMRYSKGARSSKSESEEWNEKISNVTPSKNLLFFPLTMGHEFLIQENLLFYSLHISPFTICKTNYILHIHIQHTAERERLRMFHKKTYFCMQYCTWWKNEIKKKKNWRKMEDIPKRNLYIFFPSPFRRCRRRRCLVKLPTIYFYVWETWMSIF